MAYCNWDSTSEENIRYHDTEWGVPLHDDRMQFEFLMMEVMQCGLSWQMMIQRREVFRSCFDNFEYDKIAEYSEADIRRIMETPGMIRSRRKIEAIINNARKFQDIRSEFSSFSAYLWRWSGGKTILYDHHAEGIIPASNGLSETISQDLRSRGFKFLGPTTVYSHLQACGIINDHGSDCPRYRYINEHYPTVRKRSYLEKGVVDYSLLSK